MYGGLSLSGLTPGDGKNNMFGFIKKVFVIPRPSFFEIRTTLNRTAVRDILEREVEKPLPFIRHRLFSGKFVGEAYSSGFEIELGVWYDPAFDARFHGSFERTNGGVALKVEASNAFATVGTCVLWFVSVGTLYSAFLKLFQGEFVSAGMFALIGTVFSLGAIIGGTVYERTVREGKRRLLSMFDDESQMRKTEKEA